MIVDRVFRDCPIVFEDRVFPGDLLDLAHREYDVILGMDWLSKHRVVVDCQQKKISLRTSSSEEVFVKGVKPNFLGNVISTVMARKLIC